MAKRKNPAALALARKSVRSRMKSKTPEQRSIQAQRAAQTRWRKAKPPATQPSQWYGLFALDDPNHPEKIAWSRNRQELVERARMIDDRTTVIFDLDYDPGKLTIVREFAPDVEREVAALKALVTEEGDQS